MKTYPRLLVIGLAFLGLSACKEVQLGGPVTNADIFIDLLNQPGASSQSLETTDRGNVIEQFSLEKWNTMPDYEKFLWVGNFEADPELVDPESLYLVAARYGEDVDADRDGEYDNFPLDIEGQWHAIMTGTALLANANVVSALTEAAYQYVRRDIGLIPDAEIQARLDTFAQLVVSDMNRDGIVNYSDVLRWTRLYSTDKYLGDIALVDNLIDVISTDQAEYLRDAAAASVWRKEVVDPVRPSEVEGTHIGGNVSGDVFWTREFSPYVVDASMNIDGELHIEGGVEIQGRGRVVAVNGDLYIEGVPRQAVEIEDLVITINSFGESAESVIRYADFKDGRLTAKIQRMTIENSRAEDWQLEVRSIVNSEDNSAEIWQNVFEDCRITFYNRSPSRDQFMVEFSNNLFIPTGSTESRLITKWEAPVDNLLVQNNSFHPDMTILRSGSNPVLDVRENYWGVESSSDIDFDTVIPDNGGESPYTYIRYLPRLKKPHPDTPAEP
jgi:hypothetical protein